jgi:uncharacterized cupin superfamily protein
LTTVLCDMSKAIVRVAPPNVDLESSEIPAEWIFAGSPKAWNREVSGSRDGMSQIVVWECTEGHFKWHYNKDESVIVISGEAFLIRENGQELRFGPGDVGFFPAGSVCEWRVPGPFRKVAVMREPMWRPLGMAVKAWNRILQMVGLTGGPPLMFVDPAAFSESPSRVSKT